MPPTAADARETHLDVFVVPHTHWDREWYLPAGRFRQRLVALVDALLNEPVPPPGSFLLDGQAAILDDYLAVRPERRDALATALATGRLEAGPWYVLADELLPSGEALVRNLLAGRRALRTLGAESPPVLYSPDAFGHAAALPALAAGFGFEVAIVWRGYGGPRWPAGDAVWWTGAGGARVLLFHLPPDGYEFGSSLPSEPAAAADRWRAMRDVLAPRARLGVVLVQNGADHHALQRDWEGAVDALRKAAAPDPVSHASLRTFASLAASRAAHVALPEVRGELRDSYGYTWTLQGTFASRTAQKRRNAHVQRTLERDVEPWLALAMLAAPVDPTRAAKLASLRAAWRTLLLCHPHDTLCGCSTDEVARAADARFDDAASQAAGLREDGIAALVGHVADVARERRADWRPCLLVRNRAPRPRGGVVEADIVTFVRDVAVGPGSAGRWQPLSPLGAVPVVTDGVHRLPLQVLDRTLRHDRIESPRHYPDDDVVESAHAVIWAPTQDGLSTHAYAIGEVGATEASGPMFPVRTGDGTLDNGLVAVAVGNDGRVVVRALQRGATVPSLLRFEDVGDAGDLYTHSPIGCPITTARLAGIRTVYRGPLRGALELRYRLRIPASVHVVPNGDPFSRPTTRARRHVDVPVTVCLVLDADAPFLRVEVDGDNRARDHRLRVVLSTAVVGASVLADAAFGPVARAPLDVPPSDRVAEHPTATAPLHRWVSLSNEAGAATIFSDGLAEYEVTHDGDVAVTLARAVSELSRPDLPERPGHAGWPVPTPEAQMIGPFAARFAIALHAPHSPTTLDAIERLADDVLLPLRGETLRSALALPIPAGGLSLEGRGLAFGAVKPSDDGDWIVLRCVNVTDETVTGAWRFNSPPNEAACSRLDETPGERMPFSARDVTVLPIVVAPRGIFTVLVR